ncbi:MAG: hypothetical protein HN348_22110 [Proteobacteria bacterium]|nr:hypothetical protein [Pseudomonadota bacterium]
MALAPWCVLPTTALALLIVLFLALSGMSHTRPPLWASCLVLGMLNCASVPRGPEIGGPVAVQGIVIGASRGNTADLLVEEVAQVGEEWQAERGRLRLVFPNRPPPPGTPIVARGIARQLGERSLPGSPDAVDDARRVAIQSKVIVAKYAVLNGKKRQTPRHHQDLQHGGVLLALATGDRSAVSDEVLTLLRRTGTAHLLAISGFHVGVIGGLFYGVTSMVLRLLALIRRTGLPTWPAWLVAISAAVSYAWAAGAPISAQRAAGVMVLVAIAAILGRRTAPLRLLATAAVAILLVDPSAIATPSFQLSFGAILGLLRLTPRILRYLPPDTTWCLSWPARSLAATMGAALGTLPAAAWWFQQLPPLSPVANLVAMPLTAIVIAPSAVAATYGPEFICPWPAAAGNLGIEVLVTILTPMSIEPWHPAVGPWGAMGLATILLFPKRYFFWAPAAFLALTLKNVPTMGTRVTFFDIGQGDSALVEYADGCRWLIDGGPPGRAVVQHLRRLGVTHLDLVVASHGQMDHIGGLLPVLDELSVDRLAIPDLEGTESLRAIAWTRNIEVLVSRDTPNHQDINDRSLVLYTGRGEALFTGDIGRDRERSARFLPAALLKVPHHGSRTSSTSTMLEDIDPVVAVVSVGRYNRFGHPNDEVIRRYLHHGIQVYRTDQHGTVQVHLFDEKMVVRTHRAGRGWSGDELFCLRTGSASSEEKNDEGNNCHNNGYSLRIGQGLAKEGGQEMAAVIASEHFDAAASHRIEHEIEEHHLAIEAFSAMEPSQEARDGEEKGRLIELGRVKGHIGRASAHGISKDHSNSGISGLAVATASKETSYSRDSMAEGEGKGEDVPNLVKRQFVPKHQR